MPFEFATAARIIFGPGTAGQLPELTRGLGTHAFVITGANPTRTGSLVVGLRASAVNVTSFSVGAEPTTDDILRGLALARGMGCDVVVGIGGGAVLDAAKAVAAFMTNKGDLFDHLEVIGRGLPLRLPSAPCIAVPTTAGTGSEVTRNAVLGSPAHRVKVSLRSVHLLPRIALVDPRLTDSGPPAVTAASGLDALTQLIEPFVSPRANALTDALCRDGIARVARSLQRAYDRGDDAAAREDMALASLQGGLALANAGLGAVHGLAGPIGGMFSAPHGAICAALLPQVMAANLAALLEREPSHPAIGRYEEIAHLVTGDTGATATAGVQWVTRLVSSLRIPRLSTFGLQPAEVDAIVAASLQASSMKANPILLTCPEIAAAVSQAL